MNKKFEVWDKVYCQDYGYCTVVSASNRKYMVRPDDKRREVHVVSVGGIVSASVRDDALKEAGSKD